MEQFRTKSKKIHKRNNTYQYLLKLTKNNSYNANTARSICSLWLQDNFPLEVEVTKSFDITLLYLCIDHCLQLKF